MSLEKLRKKIDETDDKIVRLIAERIRIAEEIGREKSKQGKQIEDIVRECVLVAWLLPDALVDRLLNGRLRRRERRD